MRNITYLCLLFITLFGFQSYAKNHSSNSAETYEEVQRVRITFTMPTGHVRHLLLGFTPDNAATDNVDYGYDAANVDNFPNDLNWMIEEGRYVIQGVGEFNNSKFYEMGMFLSDAGNIAINLFGLENFSEPINVYVYDALLNTYTSINETGYINYMNAGTYLKRFYLTFNNVFPANLQQSPLTNEEFSLEKIDIRYLKHRDMIQISNPSVAEIEKVDIYNALGQHLFSKLYANENNIQISLNGIKTDVIIVKVTSNQKYFGKKLLIH
jgi:hypothetical protein